MIDTFLLLTPVLMLAVVALLAFVGCSFHEGAALPQPPTGLTATGGCGRVNVTWDLVDNATSYDLYRADISNPIYSGPPPYTDTNVTSGVPYCYQVTVTVVNVTSQKSDQQCVIPAGQPFVTFDDQQPGLHPRQDFDNYLGMAITVGARSLSICALGRWSGLGVSQTHLMQIFDVGQGQVLSGSSVTVDPNTSFVRAGFLYSDLPQPVTLQANSKYYILTKENLNGDKFYDNMTTLTSSTPTLVVPTADATIDSPVYFATTYITPAGITYGPVNFLYNVV